MTKSLSNVDGKYPLPMCRGFIACVEKKSECRMIWRYAYTEGGSRASPRWRSMRRRARSAISCSIRAARKRAAGQPSLSVKWPGWGPRRTVEKALTAVIQEAYIQGISTRSVDNLV